MGFEIRGLSFAIIFTAGLCLLTGRASAATAPPAGAGQNAIINVESSMVYEAPSFDAPMIGEIKGQTKVRISMKKFGNANVEFYKVKTAEGKIGFIADIDVLTESRSKAHDQQVRSERKRALKQQKAWDKDTDRISKPDTSIFESNYVGAFYGVWNYRQDLAGATQQDALGFYGIKLTTPHLLKRGPLFEANLGLHVGAPAFFQKVSVNKPKGFMADFDLLLLNPILRGEHWMGYVGLGPLLHFRSITTSPGGSSVTSNNVRVGASFSLGGAYQFGRFCARLEGKYLWEHTGQTALLGALQTSF